MQIGSLDATETTPAVAEGKGEGPSTATTNVVSSTNTGATPQQPSPGAADPSDCTSTSISMSNSATNATMTPTDGTPATSGGTRTASPRTASSEDANTLCGLANFNNMRVTADNVESGREASAAELRDGTERGVSNSKSMSSGGVAENTASAANMGFGGPVAMSGAHGGESECAHATNGNSTARPDALVDSKDPKATEDTKESKPDEGSDAKDSQESKSNTFIHVDDSRGSALSSDNLLVC